MIVKGCSHSGQGLASYLMHDKNDRAEVLDIRGDLPRDLKATLDDWRSDRLGTHCSKPLYHAQINPDRVLTAEEWDKAIGIFEKAMGFENQPRVIVLHDYKDREHVHLVYSRIDEHGKAISDSWNYVSHEKAAREIERELGLERTRGVFIDRDGERPARTPSHGEMQQGERTKRDPHQVRAEVSELYRSADSGRAFVAALDDAGYTLARGDQRGYVLVDEMGGVHSLARMAGVKVDALRETLQAFPLRELPSVDAARERSPERLRGAPEAELRETLEHQRAEPEPHRSEPTTGLADAPVTQAREDDGRARLGPGALDGLANGAEALAHTVLDFLAGDGRPPPTPEQQQAMNERAARLEAFNARQARYAEADRQKQEQEIEAGKTRGLSLTLSRERERERER